MIKENHVEYLEGIIQNGKKFTMVSYLNFLSTYSRVGTLLPNFCDELHKDATELFYMYNYTFQELFLQHIKINIYITLFIIDYKIITNKFVYFIKRHNIRHLLMYKNLKNYTKLTRNSRRRSKKL